MQFLGNIKHFQLLNLDTIYSLEMSVPLSGTCRSSTLTYFLQLKKIHGVIYLNYTCTGKSVVKFQLFIAS